MSIISETLISYLPGKRKTTPSGWATFNAPCCVYNGETQDTKQRGGLIENGDSVSYHCFNCGFKASWQSGRTLNYKMRKLMSWLNVPDSDINRLGLEALRLGEGVEQQKHTISLPKFETAKLPDNTVEIQEDPCATGDYEAVLNYMRERQLWLDNGYRYFWCNNPVYKQRLIIPFYHEQHLVGWTARMIDPNRNPRYLMETQPGFVYGLNEQTYDKQFCLVTEGPIDAIHIKGTSIMGSEISEQQALLLNRLNKEIVIVPDRDSKGQALMMQALELGWSVSLPDWHNDIKDVSDCVKQYGSLYALYSIVAAKETSALKTKLKAKKWFV